jgi:hypothetical protein
MKLIVIIVLSSFFLSSCGGGSMTTMSQTTPAANEWTWVSGANVVSQPGVYGTQGMPSASNVPGGRNSAVGWTDAAGNFWLFGGVGLATTDTPGALNDLWEFSAGQWTWIGGSNLPQQPGSYGTLGVAAPGNIPGARSGAVSWKDASGNFWLFGGYGEDSSGQFMAGLNDLWKYSSGQWTWMSGSNAVNGPGTYGTQGVAAPGNVPGARESAVGWVDSTGSLWLFGGNNFNDLWKYSGGEWTWVGGSNASVQPGTYGTQGVAASGNIPGSRNSAVSWTDASGNFWLFGGQGLDSTGAFGDLNDLWKYSAGQWTWVSGSNLVNQQGAYGKQGTASPNNFPGARDSAVSWTDAAGTLWLFGGESFVPQSQPPQPAYVDLNDLWKYAAGEWTWVSGADTANQPGMYGTEGTASPNNVPGARDSAVGWTDASGTFWLFGGYGVDTGPTQGGLNDLWKLQSQ